MFPGDTQRLPICGPALTSVTAILHMLHLTLALCLAWTLTNKLLYFIFATESSFVIVTHIRSATLIINQHIRSATLIINQHIRSATLIINQHIIMISEGSCDTEDWSNDAENSALITGINYILKYRY